MKVHTTAEPQSNAAMDINPDTYRQLLAIVEQHELVLADSRVRIDNSTERQSHLLREVDAEQNLIAHYRVYIHQSGKPPFREQRGWEKFSPEGKLLDREVRYKEQPTGTQLH